MYFPDDFYTVTGVTKLFNCWTDKVTKFDTSSFYNWEQDNLPIYDLDERTYLLWEKLGYPTSSVPGAALVVSADVPDELMGCSKNIFRDIKTCIEAIPKYVNFPVVVEIANFGLQDSLELRNFTFGPSGSLEIVNKNFAHTEAGASSTFATVLFISERTNTEDNTDGLNEYNFASGVSSVDYAKELLDAKYAPLDQAPFRIFKQSKCESIDSFVYSSTLASEDQRINNTVLNGYVKSPSNLIYNRGTLVIPNRGGSGNRRDPSDHPNGEHGVYFEAYEYNPNNSDEIHTKDASSFDLVTDERVNYENNIKNGTEVISLFYGNTLPKIIIDNCNGPIYVRNFFVDGSGSTVSNNDYGVFISNSTNIYLENIVSTRHRRAGIKVVNSEINILRSCVATRNYGFTPGDSERLIGPWEERINYIDLDNSFENTLLRDDDSAGLHAINSLINISSTQSHMDNLYASKLDSLLGEVNLAKPTETRNTILEFSRNTIGINLENSILKGGVYEDKNKESQNLSIAYNTALSLELNTGYGLKAVNSKYSLNGRTFILGNLVGADCFNSTLELDKLTAIGNQKQAVKLNISNLIYNKNSILPTTKESDPRANYDTFYHYDFSANGSHLELFNSKLLPVQTSAIIDKVGRFNFSRSFGRPVGADYLFGNSDGILPAISLKNNSEAKLIHCNIIREDEQSIANFAVKGSEISVTNGSTMTLQGSKHYATKVFGPPNQARQERLAGAYAGQGSKIEINGPTAFAQFGVDLYAEDNSIIAIKPPTDNTDANFDVDSYNLNDPFNHTMVELHSTRSCIVLDKHSTLNIKDLGYYKNYWKGEYGVTAVTDGPLYDPGSNGDYISSGFIQFYPNPIDGGGGVINNYNIGAKNSGTSFQKIGSHTIPALLTGKNQIFDPGEDTTTYTELTYGGMCVRALNQSHIDLKNVHFPCGFWNPSDVYYDTTGGSVYLCNKLFIWNIGNDSTMESAFVSVEEDYPEDANYHGPLGGWLEVGSEDTFHSGAPMTTPDTESLSLIDFYAPCSGNPWAPDVHKNKGPFRLYFSVHPEASILSISGLGGRVGEIDQIYSQGYHASSNCFSIGPSSLDSRIRRYNTVNSQWETSGYYYSNEIISNQNGAVLLDESSSNLFANAKHCSIGKSNIPTPVRRILPYTQVKYGDFANDTYRDIGRGFRSSNTFELDSKDS